MKNWTLLFVAGSLAGPISNAEAQVVTPSISATGQGSWEMLCHIVADGEQSDRFLGPNRSSYSNPKLQRAECSYKAPQAAPLVITIAGSATCPFKGASADACTLTEIKGRAGKFELKFKAGR